MSEDHDRQESVDIGDDDWACLDELKATQEEPTKKRLSWADEAAGLPLAEVVIIPRRKRRRNTNKQPHIQLLGTAFCTFMAFAIIQMVVAIMAQSQSLIGDSAIMIVDSLTYLFNWVAEVRKGRYEDALQLSPSNNNSRSGELQATRERTKRKIVLQMEIFPPIVSMISLLVVIFFLFNKSIRALLHGNQTDRHSTNVQIMMGFAFFNLILDILNFSFFARARHHLLGFPSLSDSRSDPSDKSKEGTNDAEEEKEPEGNDDIERCDVPAVEATTASPRPQKLRKRAHNTAKEEDASNKEQEDDKKEHGPANLNMCSAFTHVFADMLRSIAVIVAAVVAKAAPGVSVERADESAALVVYSLILVSIVPLVRGLCQLVPEYRAILAQERAEGKEASDAASKAEADRSPVDIGLELASLYSI